MPGLDYGIAGSETTVICIHCSVSTSKQWQPLVDRLSNQHRMLAPDLYGYGESPAWNNSRMMTVDDEILLLQPVFESVVGSIILVGHSWGAAVALKAALKYRNNLKLMILFEPALWSLLISGASNSFATKQISQIRDDSLCLMEDGNWSRAAEYFLQYWAGPNAWDRISDTRRLEIIDSMPAVKNDWHASFSDPMLLSDLAVIDVPVLLMTGTESPATAGFLVQQIGRSLPQAKIIEMAGLGHMAPITDTDQVNDAIEKFILEHCA